MNIAFRVRCGDKVEEIDSEVLGEFADRWGLARFIPGRYSALFVLDLLMNERLAGLDPGLVISEISSLECCLPSLGTKSATKFTRSILKGLWHKHFFPNFPSVFVKNIQNYLGENGLESLVREILDSRVSPFLTKAMISEFADRLVYDSIEKRAGDHKLTGEWIIFARHDEKNYYLCISSHRAGDKNVADKVMMCSHEFPFLHEYPSLRRSSGAFYQDET